MASLPVASTRSGECRNCKIYCRQSRIRILEPIQTLSAEYVGNEGVVVIVIYRLCGLGDGCCGASTVVPSRTLRQLAFEVPLRSE